MTYAEACNEPAEGVDIEKRVELLRKNAFILSYSTLIEDEDGNQYELALKKIQPDAQ